LQAIGIPDLPVYFAWIRILFFKVASMTGRLLCDIYL